MHLRAWSLNRWDREKQAQEMNSKSVIVLTNMDRSGGRVGSVRVYRQSVCYPETDVELLFDVTTERLSSEQPHEYRLLYSCKHFFINGHAPESFVDKLSVSVAQALYPIDLSINRNDGSKQVNNSKEIIERWETKKKELLRENAGEYMLTYISRMDAVLRDAGTILSAIEKNFIFIDLFVIPLSVDGQSFFQKTNRLYIPSGQYGNGLIFRGKFIQKEDDEELISVLSFEGRAARYFTTPEGELQEDNYRAEVSYFVSKETKTIDDIYADTYLLSGDGEERESLFQSVRIHYLRN